jgi:hypothetical protein
MPLESVGIRGASEEVSVPWGSEGLERRTLEGGYRVFVGGLPRYASSKTTLVHDDAEIFMDPCDRGIGCEAPERKVESAAALPPVIATPLSVGRSGAASAGATAAIGEMGHGSTSFPVEAGAASALASHVGIVLEPWQLLPAANAPLQQEQFAAPRRGQVQDLQRVAGAEHWGSVSTSVGVFHSKQTSEPCPGPQSVDPNYVSQWLIPLEGTQTG